MPPDSGTGSPDYRKSPVLDVAARIHALETQVAEIKVGHHRLVAAIFDVATGHPERALRMLDSIRILCSDNPFDEDIEPEKPDKLKSSKGGVTFMAKRGKPAKGGKGCK